MASGSRSISKGSEEAILYECDPCKNQEITSEAKAYCTVCTEYLCQRCEITHKGSKFLRDHKLLTGNDMKSVSMATKSNDTIFCDTHKSMEIQTYCTNHDDVICGTCKITDHMKCVTTDINVKKKHVDVAKLLDGVVKSFKDLKLRYEKLNETRKLDITKLQSQFGKCLQDMRNMRKEINKTLDKLERKFENEMKETEERMKKENGDHVKIAEDALLQISNQVKSLGFCRNLPNDYLKFVNTKRAAKLAGKYDRTLLTVQQGIYPIQIRFRANDVISDVIQQLTCIGTLDGLKHPQHPPTTSVQGSSSLLQVSVVDKRQINVGVKCIEGDKHPQHPPTTSVQGSSSLLQVSVVDKRQIDVGVGFIYGCTFMKSGHLVLACEREGLVLLNESFKVQSKLSIKSMRVAAINENEVVVTQGDYKQLLRVRLFPKMFVMTTVKMDGRCYGVDVFINEIYVRCDVDGGHYEIQVLNMEGRIQRKLGVNNGECIFKDINDVKVSRDGSKIFVSDVGTHKVTCLNQQGHVIYQYPDPDLKFPEGLYVDEDDTLLVCGCDSNNIHMVGRDGRKIKIWLTEKDGVVYPYCISYRQKDGCLVVGLDKTLIAFNT